MARVGAFKPDKRCKVCKLIKAGDEKLFTRIAFSRQFARNGEPLTDIVADYPGELLYQSLYNHARKHQAPNSDKLVERRMNAIAAKADQLAYREVKKTGDVRQNLLERLAEKLENGEFDGKMTVKDLLATLRDADNAAAKKTDQQIDIMKAMMESRSGEIAGLDVIDEEFDPWNQDN
jgi:hypothetical protein